MEQRAKKKRQLHETFRGREVSTINWKTSYISYKLELHIHQMSHPLPQEMELLKMETAYHDEDEEVRNLYDAAYEGSVLIFNSLIEQDPLILHKICSRTTFVETPFHISSLLGHLEFIKTLLTLKPTLAREFDPF